MSLRDIKRDFVRPISLKCLTCALPPTVLKEVIECRIPPNVLPFEKLSDGLFSEYGISISSAALRNHFVHRHVAPKGGKRA